jgi:CubicO group peptidase (beta-lactamase class C family)
VLDATGGTLVAADRPMTFWHLVNAVTGYARIEAPGAAWAYNDVAIALRNRLVETIYGGPLDAPLRERLAPLRLQDGSLLTTRNGFGVSTTTRDFARIGWFWLNRGNWNGSQILAESFFDAYMRPQVPGTTPRTTAPDADYLNVGSTGGGTDQTPYGPGIFGLNWWFNDIVGTTGLRAWPDAPLDTVQAIGHFNREFVVMIPSLNMVITNRGLWGTFQPGNASSGINQRFRLLMAAVQAVPATAARADVALSSDIASPSSP